MSDILAFLNARLDEKKAAAEAAGDTRALREVTAIRAIVERYELACDTPQSLVSFTRGQDDGYRQACMDAIRDHAAVCSDHPDYDPAWALT